MSDGVATDSCTPARTLAWAVVVLFLEKALRASFNAYYNIQYYDARDAYV